jgi:hypothetical protein
VAAAGRARSRLIAFGRDIWAVGGVTAHTDALLRPQVRTGDVVAAVNGVNVLGLPLSAVKPLLAGPAGMTLRLSVLRREGEAVLSLVRHETQEQIAGPISLQGAQMVKVPLHKLIVWDHGLGRQVSTPWPRSELQLPDGFLDVTVIDVENLPVCYDIGWGISSFSTGTASPYVEGAVKSCRLRTSSQSSKLSAAINQTLRLPVIDTSPLCIRIKNDDVSVGGDVIGEVKFPMQQIATDGFQQKGRFRMTVAPDLAERVPTLYHLEEGDEVTGLKSRPATVQLELAYRGRPYTVFQQEEWMRDEQLRTDNERLTLEQEHQRLIDERRRAEKEERSLLERDKKEATMMAEAAVKKAQREAKVREEVYSLSKTKLAEEREAWLLGRTPPPPVQAAVAQPPPAAAPAPESKSWWDALPKMPTVPMPAMPELPAMPKMDLTKGSDQADNRNLANVELVLDMDIAEVTDEPTFKREVEEDVSAALGPAAKKCRVTRIRSGSVIVDLEIELSDSMGEQVWCRPRVQHACQQCVVRAMHLPSLLLAGGSACMRASQREPRSSPCIALRYTHGAFFLHSRRRRRGTCTIKRLTRPRL